MPTRRTTLLLDADLLDRLDRLVARAGSTKTAVIGRALEAWLEENEPEARLGFISVGRSSHGRLSLDGRSIVRREAVRRGRFGA